MAVDADNPVAVDDAPAVLVTFATGAWEKHSGVAKNIGATTLYVGPATVTATGATKGYPWAPGEILRWNDLAEPQALYAICAAGETGSFARLGVDV